MDKMQKIGAMGGSLAHGDRGCWGSVGKALPADVRALIGKKLGPTDLERLRGAYGSVRQKKPGYAYTMDYRPERLNVHTGADDVVTGFAWG